MASGPLFYAPKEWGESAWDSFVHGFHNMAVSPENITAILVVCGLGCNGRHTQGVARLDSLALSARAHDVQGCRPKDLARVPGHFQRARLGMWPS